MKLKVCGMRDAGNLRDLCSEVNPDYTGFIFYEKSPRYFLDGAEEIPSEIPPKKRVGVFVNASKAEIIGLAQMFQIENIQLHGNESPELCRTLVDGGFAIIKAFGISELNDFQQVENYTESCHYFLFDTKTKLYGGSGKKFDWTLMDQINFQKPWFLSGGIDLDDIEKIRSLKNQPFAIDINSSFEINAGLKDIEKIKTFKKKLFKHG